MTGPIFANDSLNGKVNMETEILRPRASSLIESMRDIGYSLETAVADILDNSITAKAKNIDIQFGWSEDGRPWLAIIDDGQGMSNGELLEAMRPGSRSPLDKRDLGDLGRFGLGLKTASFSQCRKLTVTSRKDDSTNAKAWDLDLVRELNEWVLITVPEQELLTLPGVDRLEKTGTCVLWENLDRLDLGEDTEAAHVRLNERVAVIQEHLSLVFHRFLLDESGRKKLRISINGTPVDAYDPFNASHLGTTLLREETLLVEGEKVTLQPYILPHHTKIGTAEYEKLAGRDGYLRGQGFYIYRNKRLIIHGTWFRMARQEQMTKLARVRVDIPNTLDHLWTIDVRKSRAHPPEAISRRMAQLVKTIRDNSKRPYTHRGKILQESVTKAVWQRRVFNNRVEYEVDASHPLLAEFRSDLDQAARHRFDLLVRMIGSTFPGPLLYNDLAERPKQTDLGVREELLLELSNLLLQSYPEDTREEFNDRMGKTEPFASNRDFIQQFLQRHFQQADPA